MKKIMIRPMAVKSLTMLVLFAILSSFAPVPGGDSFEIYVNNKLVVQERVLGKQIVANLSLNEDADQDQLYIHYSHCGLIGTSRNIIIRDEQNKVLREWKFSDAPSGTKNPMTCKVKDIVALTNGHHSLTMYYSSKELQKEQLLAAIHLVKKSARN